ncbi:ImmA/IrrE family metallo-endopeptidase [Kocuria oceani]|uniref:ImmA/IrrE family metallo-endopeptidase n=1 Tax=Kocuria oceani TaxID=988827 RepID=A0ABV9TK40_9MICC|nr:ImmA/IrrE family metallo-endopeptidase [Kocuria oceani]
MTLERLSAVTDGHSTIWLDDRLTETEARCALAHELVHLELGHIGHQPQAVEEKVREDAARRLLPLQALYTHRHWQGRLYGLAEDLGVTEAVLTDRLRWLTQEERLLLGLLFWGPGES